MFMYIGNSGGCMKQSSLMDNGSARRCITSKSQNRPNIVASNSRTV